MTDQEGGQVRRLPGGPASSEKTIGSSSNPTGNAAAAGTTAAQVLQGVGMNVNLAPVLDVYYTAGDFIDEYQRSYSNNAGTVSSCGQAFIKAQQQALDVAATAKHFPGLGAARQTTDAAPVRVALPARELRTVDMAPFAALIRRDVPLVMLATAVYPALDPRTPAALSRAIATGELRGRLGFRGVSVTDALDTPALAPVGGPGAVAVRAAGAGSDLVMYTGLEHGVAAAAALRRQIAADPAARAAAEESVGRALALRERLR
jgi:beta-N-acetylhexosaminidase